MVRALHQIEIYRAHQPCGSIQLDALRVFSETLCSKIPEVQSKMESQGSKTNIHFPKFVTIYISEQEAT